MTISAHERRAQPGHARAAAARGRRHRFTAQARPNPAADRCRTRSAVDTRAAIERLLGRFHDRYEALKEERSALDFQDLELRALELLRSSPAVAELWRGRFSQLMIDEFQDTNGVQLALVDELRGEETRLLEVGDENQSIYRFRNADSRSSGRAGTGASRSAP